MTLTAAALRELHRIHRQIADLRDRLERGPRQLAASQASLENLQQQRDQARHNVQQSRMAVDQKQLDLKTGEQKVVDLRTKLNKAASNKEYQALLEQIAASEMAGSVLADEILEGLEKIDLLEGIVAEAEKNVVAGQQELDRARQRVEGSIETIRAELARLEPELAAAEEGLPTTDRRDYNRVVQRRGADAMASVEDSVCLGCGQQITLNMLSELKLSRLVFCKSCGCLLYEPEEG